MDPQHVKRALTAMGLNPRHDQANTYTHDEGSYNHVTGEATWLISGSRATEERAAARSRELKRAYAAELVKSQAARYGWTLRQTAKYDFVVNKR